MDDKIVIVIGAGFAGLNATKELANKPGLQVLLIDQKNHHLFQPLLYQVATAGLNPSDIAVPIRAQFDDAANVHVHLGRIEEVYLKEKFIRTKQGHKIHYDYLVVACGAKHSYFGKPEWEEFAPGLKTIEQATEIRRRILLAFENAENETDESKRNNFLNFVVVGGGPTGVEMAGAIADISQTVLTKDFKQINTRNAKVMLIEAGPRVLGAFGEELAAKARRDLVSLGVEVRTGVRVTEINDEGVQVDGGEFIPAKTVIWAAGVQASKLVFVPEISRDKSGRIAVEADFSLKEYPDVFVAGDMAAFTLPDGKTLPGLAPVAIQAGHHAAQMILNSQRGKPRFSFEYLDKGQMATIGKRKAVARIGNFKLSGYPAWLGWLFVHVLYLIGFKNKIAVLLQWAWSYLFSRRGSRLITEREWKLEK